MSEALLDVNVLLALVDPDHVGHNAAQEWWDSNSRGGWASCAVTELGFLRVVTQSRYPNRLTLLDAANILDRARRTPGHVFWRCESGPLDVLDPSRVHGPGQLTDAYLLGLAVAHEGTFVTLDRRVSRSAVPAAEPRHLTAI